MPTSIYNIYNDIGIARHDCGIVGIINGLYCRNKDRCLVMRCCCCFGTRMNSQLPDKDIMTYLGSKGDVLFIPSQFRTVIQPSVLRMKEWSKSEKRISWISRGNDTLAPKRWRFIGATYDIICWFVYLSWYVVYFFCLTMDISTERLQLPILDVGRPPERYRTG